jgi:hypothetical protein
MTGHRRAWGRGGTATGLTQLTIPGTTDSAGILPAPLDKGGGDSRGDRATR